MKDEKYYELLNEVMERIKSGAGTTKDEMDRAKDILLSSSSYELKDVNEFNDTIKRRLEAYYTEYYSGYGT